MSQPEQPSNQQPEQRSGVWTKLKNTRPSRRAFLAGLGTAAASTLPFAGWELKAAQDQGYTDKVLTTADHATYLAEQLTISDFANTPIKDLIRESQDQPPSPHEHAIVDGRLQPNALMAGFKRRQIYFNQLSKLPEKDLAATYTAVQSTGDLDKRAELINTLLQQDIGKANSRGF
jgi:hypothetical protein